MRSWEPKVESAGSVAIQPLEGTAEAARVAASTIADIDPPIKICTTGQDRHAR